MLAAVSSSTEMVVCGVFVVDHCLYAGVCYTVAVLFCSFFFFFSSRRRHTRLQGDWSSDVCSSDLSASERKYVRMQIYNSRSTRRDTTMRNRFLILIPALAAVVLLFWEGVAAQGFDPHDLSGIWTRTARDHSLGTKPPPLTRAGIEAMKGRIGDTDDVLREVVDAARASSQVRLNENGVETTAPWLECNPMGFPRLLNDDEPMEFIMTKDKILQVFQSEHRIRYLWTDGRELPSGQNLENLGPAWYGHSVGKWDGNTLIVTQIE